MKILSKEKHRIIRILCYVLLLAPMLYSIYYSVPASDDFSMAFGRSNSNGVLADLISTMVFFYTKRGGPIITYFGHMVLNPLNLHVHLGHLYGIYMIVIFLLCTLAVVYFLGVFTRMLLPDIEDRFVKAVQLIILAVIYSTYYYSEVFNWFVGAASYQLPMFMALLAMAYIIRYSETESKKFYVLMMIFGTLAANISVLDVPLGLFYLYIIYYKGARKLGFRNALPLLLMIASGLVSALAPGNSVRRSQYVDDGSGPSFVRVCLQVCIDIAERTFRIIVDHPFTVVLFVLLILIGVFSNHKKREKTASPLLVFILGLIAEAGSLFPYVYARGFTTTYVDIRVQYVMDYFIELILCAVCILVGRLIAYKVEIKITGQSKVSTIAILAAFTYACVINNYGYLEIAQVGILKEHSTIAANYNYWDEIYTEIENSDESDITIERDYSVIWSEYCFASGIESGEVYDDEPSVVYSAKHIMPNVYFHKDSLVVNYPAAEE